MTTTARTIKVHVPLTLEIDVKSWQGEYGGETAADIRKDVRLYVNHTIYEHLRGLSVLPRPEPEFDH